MRMLDDGYHRGKRNLMKQLRELKTDVQALKVSFVYIHQVLLVVAFHGII
jgi:hypothetical protein